MTLLRTAGMADSSSIPANILPNERFEILTAARTLNALDHDKTFSVASTTEFPVTLPPLIAGFRCAFICGLAPSGASYTFVTPGSANVILGNVVTSATGAADTETSGGDTVSFVDAVAVKGDRIDFECDGTNWYAYGQCAAAGGITITTAS